jgi:hypothetical protein
VNLIFRKVYSTFEITLSAICRHEAVDAAWKPEQFNVKIVALTRENEVIANADDIVFQEKLFNLR